MAGSLKDQLLKAGLVSEKQLKQVAHDQRKGGKGNTQQKGTAAQQNEAQRAADTKAARDRELNRKRQEEAERKALFAQIKQLVESNRLDKTEGDIPFNFTDGSKIKRLYVTKEIQEQLVAGTLSIVRQGGRYHLLRPDVAEKIRERNPASVITIDNRAETPDADDPYAAYQVPDDLIW
jgi:uncharacterized protein YaiL (DUF2058 family)